MLFGLEHRGYCVLKACHGHLLLIVICHVVRHTLILSRDGGHDHTQPTRIAHALSGTKSLSAATLRRPQPADTISRRCTGIAAMATTTADTFGSILRRFRLTAGL